MRTFYTNKGSVESHLTDEAAVNICRGLRGDFAASLVAQHDRWVARATRALSPAQLAWVHKMAIDSLRPAAPRPAPVALGAENAFQAIASLFQTARAHLKYPKIRLKAGGRRVVLSVAGERSRNPGTVNVTDGGPFGDNVWYGRVNLDGTFSRGQDCPETVLNLLIALAADPAGTAAAYGRESGNCCFCGKDLTDPRSTTVGYGPICAGHYGLPWGEAPVPATVPVTAPATVLPPVPEVLANTHADDEAVMNRMVADAEAREHNRAYMAKLMRDIAMLSGTAN